MRRNLDIAALRSLLAIEELGGMTAAAQRLNLTQSAVSMQVKRLEDALGIRLFSRDGRRITPTGEGVQLIDYARRVIALHDEVIERLVTPHYEGTITLGIPHDIVHPHMPVVLRRFGADFPRMQVRMTVSNTVELLREFKAGKLDLILTTERKAGRGGIALKTEPLVWVGAPDGHAHERDPLPIAFSATCAFRRAAIDALDAAGIEWFDAVLEASDDPGLVAAAADMAVRAHLGSDSADGVVPVRPRGRLPELPAFAIVLYAREGDRHELVDRLVGMIREAYSR